MTRSWLWRGVVLAWAAGVDLVLVAPVAACVWLALESKHAHEAARRNASLLVVGDRYIRLKG